MTRQTIDPNVVRLSPRRLSQNYSWKLGDWCKENPASDPHQGVRELMTWVLTNDSVYTKSQLAAVFTRMIKSADREIEDRAKRAAREAAMLHNAHRVPLKPR